MRHGSNELDDYAWWALLLLPPGSPEAIYYGCACPASDNRNGQGYRFPRVSKSGNPMYLIAIQCPHHRPLIEWSDLEKDERTQRVFTVLRILDY